MFHMYTTCTLFVCFDLSHRVKLVKQLFECNLSMSYNSLSVKLKNAAIHQQFLQFSRVVLVAVFSHCALQSHPLVGVRL